MYNELSDLLVVDETLRYHLILKVILMDIQQQRLLIIFGILYILFNRPIYKLYRLNFPILLLKKSPELLAALFR